MGSQTETLNDALMEAASHVMSDDSMDTLARRSFSPRKIDMFNRNYSTLTSRAEFQFIKNMEAERLLPGIINNPVQEVMGADAIGADGEANFHKQRNVGVVFSGGPAPGGHNVIAGLYDEIKRYNGDSRIFGFLQGPDGLLESRYIEITGKLVDRYRNLGGFTMIKTGRTKIDSGEKMEKALVTCKGLNLDALVIIGGDDSNTNAAFLAQHFKSSGIKVIGIPKTIDGDIQVQTDDGQTLCAVSFGFHSAARAFARNISNLSNDGSSDVKYWHVCRVMGRVASHLTLESALQTHVNLALIGEELADYVNQDRLDKAEKNGEVDYNAYGITLRHLSRVICDIIVRRAAYGKNYGVMIIPEGILEFINEIQVFIIKLNKIIAEYNKIHDIDFHHSFPNLSGKLDYLRRIAQGMIDTTSEFPIWNMRDDELFNQLPNFFKEGLLVERDGHGNFQFSQVETERIIMGMVREYLDVLKEQGVYKIGIKRSDYVTFMSAARMDAEMFAPALFKNPQDEYVLVKPEIISMKTLKAALVNDGMIDAQEALPQALVEIFKKSEPDFKIQTHFYGYDGRGSDPTYFDCNYAYNLGLTAFHLIAGNATGQMAAILNLEQDFENWIPIGIPIARLMHLEERKGKLDLVIEKSIVDLESNAFKVFQAFRENWVAADAKPDRFRNSGPVQFAGDNEEDRPLMLKLNALT